MYRHVTLSVFRERNFLLLWSGRTTSRIGEFFGNIALSWLVYTLTGSAAALGSVWILYFVPSLFVRLVAGVYIDRWDRKRVMIVTEALRGIIFLLIAMVTIYGGVQVWMILLASGVVGIVGAIFEVANFAFLPSVVKREQLLAANSVLETTFQLAAIVGPAAAGLAVALFGTGVSLLVNALSFFIFAFLLSFIIAPSSTASQSPRPSWFREFREGLGFYKEKIHLVWLLLFIGLVNFAFAPLEFIFLVALAKDVLRVGSEGFGFMSSSAAVGVLLGGLAMGVIGVVERRREVILAALFGLGSAIVLLGYSWNLFQALVLILLVGFTLSPINIVGNSILQEQVPRELLGRVFSILRFMAQALMPLGLAVGGVVATFLSLTQAIVSFGILIILVAFAASLSGHLRLLNSGPSRPTV